MSPEGRVVFSRGCDGVEVFTNLLATSMANIT